LSWFSFALCGLAQVDNSFVMMGSYRVVPLRFIHRADTKQLAQALRAAQQLKLDGAVCLSVVSV